LVRSNRREPECAETTWFEASAETAESAETIWFEATVETAECAEAE